MWDLIPKKKRSNNYIVIIIQTYDINDGARVKVDINIHEWIIVIIYYIRL